MREDKLARLMFYGGCACLPWLWCVNIMYFRKQIFGPIPVWDTWLFRSDEDCDTVRAIDGPPALGAISGDGDEDENEFHDDHSIPENLNEEVTKWVKRSTFGAASVLSIFVAWIVTFQLNKDSFPSSWFVMDEDEGEKTGW
mmetsp:Transcript_40712/g.122622  ORF Transcript_40712/g.122622 Transcript_40712/m.122622 type:complete len:141 (+) Transcript_40712:414-836(+)|eukprot:CAMPEP_0113570426 /NCGR_PEP_ID=MMETSP0015_2-20120614/24960_1 /TAXON_ID=2838 /ORGANISM="Odontella" /LENGTH=140 /DNA_ID=CAMNT_0000473201 /DNA_START=322 /DNA_END=741 /DNA_ORIENTATION=- /assembly_acc=CAM_ASM_000160